MKDKTMSDGEVKARLAQAEAHFSHYRWDDAIALFEAVLASHPDHPLATQGWARAAEQKNLDEELRETLAKGRASLAAQRFDETLALLNHAQTRGALSHILKYHSEIDGLRSEAQEGQEWQRRVDATLREAEALAGRRRFDQALEALDDTLRPLSARGWERLGISLAALREKLWAERDVSERVQFAQSAYEREDFALATDLAASLHEELPGRDDVRRLHERSRAAWSRLRERLAAVDAALTESRVDDALALLSSLRAEHPRNPDWQAVALCIYLDQGRARAAEGRAAMAQLAFEAAASAFDATATALSAVVEIFPDHPTAAAEQTEAGALRQAALAANQAARDRAAFRWDASHGGWQTARDHLAQASSARGRDFGDIKAILDASHGEAEAALSDLHTARLTLADGRQALESRDVGAARDAFRSGLSLVEGDRLGDTPHARELREGLAAGLRDAERIQRDVKKLLTQVDAASGERERLALLRRAYERWETAPGLTARLADALLAAASAEAGAGDEDVALTYCAQVAELTGAPAGALADAQRMAGEIAERRSQQVAAAEASEREARQEAEDAALRPILAALDAFETLCEPAAGGDLAAVDWEAIEAALGDARKSLAAARRALKPTPPRCDELKVRVDSAERLAQALTSAVTRIEAGRAVEAIPALQAHAAADPHPLVAAVLERLVRSSAGEAAHAARDWQARAVDALERGELATAAAYLDLARSYTVAAADVVPEIRRTERQIALLTEARDRTREGHAALAGGDLRAALAAYRAALEVAAEGESGLPPAARRALHRILEAQDAGEVTGASDSLLGDDSHPLAREFVAPALARWLRLARQSAALRQVETQVALGRHAAAAEVAAQLAGAYPRDPQMADAFRSANAGAAERLLARGRRRLARARRLADQGAYAEALAEIDPAVFDVDERAGDEGEALAVEAADLRTALERLAGLAAELKPLLEQMREAALAGQYDAALAARLRAEFLDPGRRATALWEDIDGLAALIETRRAQRLPQSSPSRPEEPPPPASEAAPPAPPRVESPAAEPLPAPVEAQPPVTTEPFRAEAPVRAEPPAAPEAARQPADVQPPAEDEAPACSEPPTPFDLDDWLSNVTDLGPEDGPPENGS